MILRRSERWWGRSQSGSRLLSCPVQLHAGPEVGDSLRDDHATSTPLPAWRISVQLLVFSPLLVLLAVSEGEHAAARLKSPSMRRGGAQINPREGNGAGRAGRGAVPARPGPARPAPRTMSNNTVYNVRARQTLSHGANVYELTQSTEKRSQFLISFWKEKKKKRNPSKTFPLIQNNGTHLPDKTSATRIWGKLKRCTKKWNKKINPQNKRLTTCQSAPKSCHSISTHRSPLADEQ